MEQRYNRAKTLQVHFVESYTVQGRARKSESGELTLRKPGRMRWDYSAPSGKLFVSDGKDVYLYTPEAHRVEKTKLKASDDMRAPLAFLLGKLDFAKDFRDFEIKPEGTSYLITAKAKNDKFPYEKIQMLVTPDYEIQRMAIDLQDESILTFQLDGESEPARGMTLCFSSRCRRAQPWDAEGGDNGRIRSEIRRSTGRNASAGG